MKMREFSHLELRFSHHPWVQIISELITEGVMIFVIVTSRIGIASPRINQDDPLIRV